MLGHFFNLRRRRTSARVSVVIPLYNHEQYIAEAVDSVLAQGAILHELIVIDDGSKDGSADVMERLARKDPRINFTRQSNRGAHATLNKGILRATGEFVAILNSDDAFLPGRLDALVDAMDDDTTAELATSRLLFWDECSRPRENSWYEQALQERDSYASLAVALINGNFLMTTSNYVVRRSLFDTVGFFAGLRYAHDLDFALRLLAQGRSILVLDAPLLRYRMHASNTISEDHRRVRGEWAICAAAYYAQRLDSPDAPAWDEVANIEDVLYRHDLAKPVHLVMAYLRRSGIEPLDRSSLLTDTLFLDQLANWV